MTCEAIKTHVSLRQSHSAVRDVQLGWLLWYFYTGSGGPQELVAHVMSDRHRSCKFCSCTARAISINWLPPRANDVIVAIYIAIAVYAFWHFWCEFERDRDLPAGLLHARGFHRGLLMFLLVMELSRLAHPTLFWINLVLVVLHALRLSEPDRLLLASGHDLLSRRHLEHGRDVDRHLRHLRTDRADPDRGLPAAGRRRARLRRAERDDQRDAPPRRPLAPDGAADRRARLAVVGTISGSGSANAVVVGTITIPLMKRYGVPGHFAAAVETAASMGGLIMPPMMGIGAFLMSEFLGVPYWDVVARGFALAAVYYVVARACGLSALRAAAAARRGRGAEGRDLRPGSRPRSSSSRCSS